MDEHTRTKYINDLPTWHKHRGGGHIIKITKFRDGKFYGEYWNYASGGIIEMDAKEDYHFSCIERGELQKLWKKLENLQVK